MSFTALVALHFAPDRSRKRKKTTMASPEDSPPAAEVGDKANEVAAAAAAAAADESNAVAADSTTTSSIGDDDQRPSDKAQPSSKKRRSNIQINKDAHGHGAPCDSDDDGALNEEGGKRSDPFKRASDGVIQKRKIVKASSKWSSGGNGGTKKAGGGMFSSVKLAPAAADAEGGGIFGSGSKVPTFGSGGGATVSSGFGAANKSKSGGGFGSGFGSVSSGFGGIKSSSSGDNKGDTANGAAAAFGGGFGSVSSGFGSLTSTAPKFTFGSNNANTESSPKGGTAGTSNGSGLAGTFATSSSKPSSASPTKFPTSSVVDTANGEQDEDCLCQVRAKLFKMVPEDEAEATEEAKEDVPSVPSTSGRMKLIKKKETEESSSPDKAKDKSPEKSKDSTEKLVQKEAGIGPVRILKRKAPIVLGEDKETKEEDQSSTPSARVVQRQETSGGGATKVILNIRLVPKTCNVIRRGDKFVQLNAPDSNGELESSLFKVKTTAEADLLEKNLKAMLGVKDEGDDA